MLSPKDRIVAEGNVTGPPDLEEIMFRLIDAADAKQPVELSAGEVRVLVMHLSDR
jgi:hypothetical protein